MSEDRAETGRLAELLARIGGGLDDFLRFEHPDALVNEGHWRDALQQTVPRQGVGIDEVVRELLELVIPNGSPISKPGFTGFITTGGTTVSTLASTAASIASPQRYLPTAFNLLEEQSLDWMAQMFGLGDMQGLYSSGGSVANLVGLGAARQAAFEKVGHDPARDGVDRPVAVYASHECHHTIQRAAGVLGLGRRAVRAVACDAHQRLRPQSLRAALEQDREAGVMPMAIVANAGTTNTGAIDPLAGIAALAREFDVWLHVDGAYGLPGILDERLADRYRGLEQADSVIVDPHKWLGSAVGVAATYVHDRSLLERAFTQEHADYLEGTLYHEDVAGSGMAHSMDDFGVPYFNYGTELSAPPRGVGVWALIREIGVDGMRERIVRHNDMARDLAARCRAHASLELLLEPTLSICCFRYRAPQVDDLNRLNHRLLRRLIRENEFMPSSTLVDGQFALRPCFLGARTGDGQVDGLLEAVLRIGDQLAAEA